MKLRTFDEHFAHLTGNQPFPWQRRLIRALHCEESEGAILADLRHPNWARETSMIAIWLLALARHVGEG